MIKLCGEVSVQIQTQIFREHFQQHTLHMQRFRSLLAQGSYTKYRIQQL